MKVLFSFFALFASIGLCAKAENQSILTGSVKGETFSIQFPGTDINNGLESDGWASCYSYQLDADIDFCYLSNTSIYDEYNVYQRAREAAASHSFALFQLEPLLLLDGPLDRLSPQRMKVTLLDDRVIVTDTYYWKSYDEVDIVQWVFTPTTMYCLAIEDASPETAEAFLKSFTLNLD